MPIAIANKGRGLLQVSFRCFAIRALGLTVTVLASSEVTAVEDSSSSSKNNIFQYVRIPTSSRLNKEVVFWYRPPAKRKPAGVLMLIPGYNGDGRGMLAEGGPWVQFADENDLILVGPTFQTSLEEAHSRHGYYYPELWSGRVTVEAIRQINARCGLRDERLLLFGFSAGAHFAHRFALWKPQSVRVNGFTFQYHPEC